MKSKNLLRVYYFPISPIRYLLSVIAKLYSTAHCHWDSNYVPEQVEFV